MSVKELTADNFDDEINNSGEKVLVDFWAPWCGPCRMVSPLVDEIGEERTDIKVCKVNVDEQPEIARRFLVMSIPTLMVFENGKVIRHEVGARGKESILELID